MTSGTHSVGADPWLVPMLGRSAAPPALALDVSIAPAPLLSGDRLRPVTTALTIFRPSAVLVLSPPALGRPWSALSGNQPVRHGTAPSLLGNQLLWLSVTLAPCRSGVIYLHYLFYCFTNKKSYFLTLLWGYSVPYFSSSPGHDIFARSHTG